MTVRRVCMIEYSIGKLYFNSCTHTSIRHFRSIYELIFKQVLAKGKNRAVKYFLQVKIKGGPGLVPPPP